MPGTPLRHWMLDDFSTACGADYPDLQRTQTEENVTCRRCKPDKRRFFDEMPPWSSRVAFHAAEGPLPEACPWCGCGLEWRESTWLPGARFSVRCLRTHQLDIPGACAWAGRGKRDADGGLTLVAVAYPLVDISAPPF